MSTEAREPKPPASRFEAFVVRFEELPLGAAFAFGILAAIISVRNLLEIAVAYNPIFDGLALLVHYPLAYVGPFLSLSLVLAAWGDVPPARVGRLMTLAWLLTLTPPLTDFILDRHHEVAVIGYLVADPGELPWIYANFFNPSVHLEGTTVGIRVEAFAAVILGGFYAFLRSGKLWRGLGCAVTVYVVSLFWFTLPTLAFATAREFLFGTSRQSFLFGQGLVRRLNPETSDDSTAILWLIPVILVLGLAWIWLERRAPADQRWFRAASDDERRRPPLPGAPMLLGLTAVGGAVAAVTIRFPPGKLLSVAPYDAMSIVGLIVAIASSVQAVRRIVGGSAANVWPLVVVAACLAAALGVPASLGMLCASLPLLALGFPHLGAYRRVVAAVVVAIAALGAVTAGFCLVVGDEGLARLPFVVAKPWVLVGLVYGALYGGPRDVPAWLRATALAAGVAAAPLILGLPVLAIVSVPLGIFVAFTAVFGGELVPRFRHPAWVTVAVALAMIFVTRATVRADEVREPLYEASTCVARLERIRAEEASEEGELRIARTRFKSALECDARDVPSLVGIAHTWVRESSFETALRWLRRAEEIAPDDARVVRAIGAVLLTMGKPSEALAYLERAAAADRRNPAVLFNRARALEELGRTSEAIEAWERYLSVADKQIEESADAGRVRRHLRTLRQGRDDDPPPPVREGLEP